MHRRRAMCHGEYGHYSHFPYSHHHNHHSHGYNACAPYEIPEPLPMPDINCCAPQYYPDYHCGRTLPCIDYPCYDYAPRVVPRPPVVQTNVHNDFCYYLDEPDDEYDDEYGNPYRLSRHKVQVVDLAQKNRRRRDHNHMVVSTFQPGEREAPERVVLPRSTVVRHTSVPTHERQRRQSFMPLYHSAKPAYERQRRQRLMPLYHSAEPQYLVSNRRQPHVRELVPVATVANPRSNKQTIRVRSLSPLI